MKEPVPTIPCEMPTHKGFRNLTRIRFGRFLVVGLAGAKHYPGTARHFYWTCQCDCGKVKTIDAGSLLVGGSKSCGCYKKEVDGKQFTTHGKSLTREYIVWCGMKRRCYVPGVARYAIYGGRGITICNRWLGSNGFANFYADMGPRPSPKHTIERRDNDGDYEPDNCYWATNKEQQRNTSRSRMLELNGRRMCVAAWAEELGVSRSRIENRKKRGWSDERALTAPDRYRRKPVNATAERPCV